MNSNSIKCTAYHSFITWAIANSADPDKTPPPAASNMGLHCLHKNYSNAYKKDTKIREQDNYPIYGIYEPNKHKGVNIGTYIYEQIG